MKKLMHKLLGHREAGPTRTDSTATRDHPLTIEDGSENATRRQLVQVLLRDALRKHGIPPGWIECQMLVVSSQSRGAGMYVRLVLKHWDERFMNYANAFQTSLLIDIERFEPNAADWLHGISWQLEVGEACPYTVMPDKSYWAETPRKAKPAPMVIPEPVLMQNSALTTRVDVSKAAAPAQPAAVPPVPNFQPTQPFKDSTPAEDLEALFAIRDREIGRQAADGYAPVGYEATQPAPLRG
jgi:hypothetical protein